MLFNAQFLALVHIIVYAGAIMILFLFTIMLMNLNKENEVHKPRITRLGAIVVIFLLTMALIFIFKDTNPVVDYNNFHEDYQSVKKLGTVMLDDKEGYMVPFEYASILLLVAMIGVVLLTKKEKTQK